MQILEEAFHLVRTTDAASFWRYYIGAVPWSVGLLYFVADMGRSSFAQRDAALEAAVLTGLYFWMKICEARFCALLWARLDPGGIPKATGVERFRAPGDRQSQPFRRRVECARDPLVEPRQRREATGDEQHRQRPAQRPPPSQESGWE